jgi:hypothetical protein
MASTLKVDTIVHTGGTTAMTLDSAGRISQPTKPAFNAYGTGAWTIFSNGAWTKIVLNATPTLNVGGHYDSTNSKFVAPVAGVYHFYYRLYGRVQSGGADSTYWQSRFQKNNSAITGHSGMIMAYYYNIGARDEAATDSMTIQLAANDEITLHAQSTGAQNGEFYGPNCNFGGHLIG